MEAYMCKKAYYIILEDVVLLSKKQYNNWKEIQDEYYEKYKASLGPWTYEELISYLEDDFGTELNWPFNKEKLADYFRNNEMICYSAS